MIEQKPRGIPLADGTIARYFVASGALGFDGKGWPWEWPLRWLGLIDPSLFVVVMKTVSRNPIKGNLRWWKPWSCVRLIKDGSVNKVGLTNMGFDAWFETVGITLNHGTIRLMGSLMGNEIELVEMARQMNRLNVAGIEINPSCPNTGHTEETNTIIRSARAVADATRHPIIVKLGEHQDYVTIARELRNAILAVSFNSVKWERVYPDRRTPLHRLEAKVKGGGGGVSGKASRQFNWAAIRTLAREVPDMPVIAPGIWEHGDIARARALGPNVQAVSFGAIHLRKPWLPTQLARRDMEENPLSQGKWGEED